MATAAQINAITALYVGYFDRAPDPAGLQFWIDQIDGGREFNTIAADFAASEEATALYPYLTTPDVSTPSAFIASIYANLFGRAPDAAGLAFWTGVLADGSVSVADMIEAIIIGAVDDADAGTFDKSVLDNKVEVGLDWALSVANVAGFTYDVDAAGAAAAAISGVTSDPATVDDALAATDAYVAGLELPTGETYTLTNGLDVLSGTPGDDNFFANNASWNVGDNVDGGLGVDTVTIANENQDLTLAGRTLTNVENVTVINIDPNTGTQDFNIANKMLDQVTVDYAGTDQETRLELDNMRADTDLVITNAIVNNDTVVRNDDGIYSTLTGSVSQNNTFSNINTVQENDYVDFENYAYFSNAMELNLSLTLEDFVTGDGGGEAGTFEDYIELEADNAVINVEYNLSNMVFENDYTEIYTYVDNATDAADADVVNVVFNIDNVDGLYVDVDPEDSGTSTDSDSVTINVGSGGLADTDSSNYFEVDYFETLNFNIDGDADFGDFNAYSGVDAPQTVNIVANANMSIDTFDLADDQVVTINISGAGDVSFDVNGDNEGLTVNAGTATGNLDLGVGSDGTFATVLTAGVGDDIITLLEAFELNTDSDAFLEVLDGGDGIDTFEITADNLVTSQGLLNADVTDFSDAIINFERLSLTGVTGQNIDATILGFNDVTIDGYTTTGDLTVETGATVTVTGAGATDYEIIIDDAAAGAADSLNLVVEGEDGIALNDLSVVDVETINLTSSATDPDETTPGANTVDLIADGATTLNISGETELVMGATTSLTGIETVDAAGFHAGLTIDVSSAAQAVAITTGDGADVVIGSDFDDTISVGNGGNGVTGGLGGDDITLGAGVTEDDVDTVAYAVVADSQGVTVDTVNGFQVAVQSTDDIDTDGDVDADDVINDLIDLSAITAGVGSYLGEAGGYGQVLTSLTASGAAEAVLDTSTSTLYIDVDGSGTLDNADMAINLTGVTDLSLDNFTF
jgi:hypothetical protein